MSFTSIFLNPTLEIILSFTNLSNTQQMPKSIDRHAPLDIETDIKIADGPFSRISNSWLPCHRCAHHWPEAIQIQRQPFMGTIWTVNWPFMSERATAGDIRTEDDTEMLQLMGSPCLDTSFSCFAHYPNNEQVSASICDALSTIRFLEHMKHALVNSFRGCAWCLGSLATASQCLQPEATIVHVFTTISLQIVFAH